MPVYDQSYQHWDGEFRTSRLRWLPMVRYHVQLMLKRRLVWLFLFLAFVPALIFSVFVYISSQADDGMARLDLVAEGLTAAAADDQVLDFAKLTTEEKYLYLSRNGFMFFLITFQALIVLSMTSLVGSGLIAKDVRSNALEIYLTKPITPIDYVLGKLTVIAVFIFLSSFVPSVIVFLVAGATWPDYFEAAWPILPPLFCACVVASLVNGMVILGLSSLAKSPRYATMIWFALCFITAMTAQVLSVLTQDSSYQLISYRTNFEIIVRELFGGDTLQFITQGTNELSVVGPIIILGSLVALSALILRNTIRSLENR